MIDGFFNSEAEKSVLAFFVTDKSSQDYMGQLIEADFYHEEHQKIYRAIQTLWADKKDADLISMSDQMLKLYGKDEAVLTSLLIEISTQFSLGASWMIKNHIEIIKAAAMRRRMFEIINGAKNNLMDGTADASVILDEVRQKLRDVVVTKHAWKSIGDVLVESYLAVERRANGEEKTMPSGIPMLDRNTTGFHRGELTIIGARPSVGKSALGAFAALSSAEAGYKVGICSREMTSEQYGARILARDSGVEGNKLRTGDLDPDDWTRLAESLSLSANLNVSFLFTVRHIEDLRMEVQKMVDSGKLDMLVVDYLQLMHSRQKFDKEYQRIGHVSKMLKDMTTDFNISILALAQVGRSSDGTMPTLAELRGSGDIEQDADNVLFLHRPADPMDKYVKPCDRDMFPELQKKGMKYMAINIAKQRQGDLCTLAVIFDPKRMRFTAIDRTKR